MNSKAWEVIKHHTHGKPALVFCASRKGTIDTANSIAKDLSAAMAQSQSNGGGASGAVHRSNGSLAPYIGPGASQVQLQQQQATTAFGTWHRSAISRVRCDEAAARTKDARLAALLRLGIGYHHAGSTAVDRSLVETLFAEGALPILCSTSTLALGVNLPAHLVVIKNTQSWRGGVLGYQEYPRSTVLQMIVSA